METDYLQEYMVGSHSKVNSYPHANSNTHTHTAWRYRGNKGLCPQKPCFLFGLPREQRLNPSTWVGDRI